MLQRPAVVDRRFALDEIPVYVRAGSIIPLQRPAKTSLAKPMDPCILSVFPGDTGSYALREDAGNSLGYQRTEYAITKIRQSRTAEGNLKLRIEPHTGSYPTMPQECQYEIRLECSWPPSSVTINGEPLQLAAREGASGWRYDGTTTRVVITTLRQESRGALEIVITFPSGTGKHRPGWVRGAIARLKRVMPIMNGFWSADWSPEVLVNAAQSGNRMGLDSVKARDEVRTMMANLPAIRSQVESLRIDASAKQRVLHHLQGIGE